MLYTTTTILSGLFTLTVEGAKLSAKYRNSLHEPAKPNGNAKYGIGGIWGVSRSHSARAFIA